MNLKERIVYIDQKLQQLYPDHQDPYTLLIAVLLSAQCTDERVNKTTPDLFNLADNPVKMASQSVEKINSIVRPCGLAPRKAQAIYDLSTSFINNTKARFLRVLRNLKSFRESDTKQLP